MTDANRTEEDVVKRLESWGVDDADSEELYALLADASREIQRLREVVTFPIITRDAPSILYIRVLAEHEKGQPVNAQDLINALMWRIKNQRDQLARLNQRVSAMLAGGDCK